MEIMEAAAAVWEVRVRKTKMIGANGNLVDQLCVKGFVLIPDA